jgi:peptidoglycan hydrolase-like protein with peptidoglycan-binding domain
VEDLQKGDAQMMNHIKFSVGEDAANNPQDVGIVQHLLNVLRKGDGDELLAVDGIVGPKTLAAIREFQQKNCTVVDGRVDPGHETIRLLNELAPQVPANDGVSFLTGRGRGGLFA